MGRAEPGQAGPDRTENVLKIWLTGLGRAEKFETTIGRVGQRPILCRLDGPDRAWPDRGPSTRNDAPGRGPRVVGFI